MNCSHTERYMQQKNDQQATRHQDRRHMSHDESRQTPLRKLQGVFESNMEIEWFGALVGFLRTS
jgi:hypothetical protein